MQGILSGGKEADAGLRRLYEEQRGRLLAYLQKQGAKTDEATDVFQEAVIAVFENIVSGKFRGESALSSYLFSIARFLWLNRLKRQGIAKRVKAEVEIETVAPSHLPQMVEKEQESQIRKLFDELGEQCREVLVRAIYYEDSMEEIAQHMAYASPQIARNKKYRCLQRLKKWLAKKPGLQRWLQSLWEEM